MTRPAVATVTALASVPAGAVDSLEKERQSCVGAVLSATGLVKGFGPDRSRLEVIRGVDLDVSRGELVAIAGRSGSGKSTLLHILGGLMHPDSGRTQLAGRDLYALTERQRARMRNRRIGFVFQMHHLLPEFTALENVMLPALIAGRSEAWARERGRDLLGVMQLSERQSHKPGELSGGEQQRVAVARALVNEPELVLADEPSGNLDEEASETLHAMLDELSRAGEQAFVVATHSPTLARRARRALMLSGGALSPMQELEASL